MSFGVNPLTGKPGSAPAPGRDGDALQARARVNEAVKVGAMPRPASRPCTDCGHVWRKPGDRAHQYDHHLGYAAAHQLDVEPVCTRCHGRRESARITHCVSGHEFTPANTITARNGTRHCRECRRAYDRRRGATTRGPEFWRNYRAARRAAHG